MGEMELKESKGRKEKWASHIMDQRETRECQAFQAHQADLRFLVEEDQPQLLGLKENKEMLALQEILDSKVTLV